MCVYVSFFFPLSYIPNSMKRHLKDFCSNTPRSKHSNQVKRKLLWFLFWFPFTGRWFKNTARINEALTDSNKGWRFELQCVSWGPVDVACVTNVAIYGWLGPQLTREEALKSAETARAGSQTWSGNWLGTRKFKERAFRNSHTAKQPLINSNLTCKTRNPKRW